MAKGFCAFFPAFDSSVWYSVVVFLGPTFAWIFLFLFCACCCQKDGYIPWFNVKLRSTIWRFLCTFEIYFTIFLTLGTYVGCADEFKYIPDYLIVAWPIAAMYWAYSWGTWRKGLHICDIHKSFGFLDPLLLVNICYRFAYKIHATSLLTVLG